MTLRRSLLFSWRAVTPCWRKRVSTAGVGGILATALISSAVGSVSAAINPAGPAKPVETALSCTSADKVAAFLSAIADLTIVHGDAGQPFLDIVWQVAGAGEAPKADVALVATDPRGKVHVLAVARNMICNGLELTPAVVERVNREIDSAR